MIRAVCTTIVWTLLGVVGVAPGQAADIQNVDDRIAVVEGLAGPEAVHWDADQQVWFVSNFNGEAAGDANGFVSKVASDGGRPADIGLDTASGRIAVPYIALDRVDLWALPDRP